MGEVYKKAMRFKRRHPGGVSWRIRKNAEVIEKHLNPGEEVLYAFAAQKNDNFYDLFTTAVIALTNKRLLIGQKRIVFGYFLSSVTPDLYNDLQVYQGLIWGKLTIDTAKEVIVLTNLPKHSLNEIETNITEFMMKEKQKYRPQKEEK